MPVESLRVRAMDSARSYDVDGRLHVSSTNISKANICKYYGKEIPGWDALGLVPDTLYRLYRHPEELQKSVATFNNLPLLSEHAPVDSVDFKPELVIGSTGTDAEFVAPYLSNSMVVWAATAILGIESGDQRELSCAYYYTPDMTAGVVDGEKYDGIMRDIRGNHVALVPAGRAGHDVMVADSVEGIKMTLSKSGKQVIDIVSKHRKSMAEDAIVKVGKSLAGPAGSGWISRRAEVARLARSLALDDETAKEIESQINAVDPASDDESLEDWLKSKLGEKLTKEEISEICSRSTKMAGDDEDDDVVDRDDLVINSLRKLIDEMRDLVNSENAKPPKSEMLVTADDPPKNPGSPPPPDRAADSKVALDEAKIVARTVARMRQISDAENAVRPIVGTLSGAFDSADCVYKTALQLMGQKTEGIHPSAYRAIFETHSAIRSEGASNRECLVARDSKAATDFFADFPKAIRPMIG